MKIALIALFSLLMLQLAAAQSHIDSLRMRVATAKSPKEKVQALNDLAWDLRQNEPQEAMQVAKESYKLAVANNDMEGQAWALRNIHVAYTVIGDLNGSIDPAWKALTLFEKLGNSDGLAAMYTNIGLVRRGQQDFEEARDMFLAALAQKPSDPFQKANVTLNLGLSYTDLRDWENALIYLQRSAELFRANNDSLTMSAAFHNIGWLFESRGEYATAIEWYRKALIIREKHHDKRRIASSLTSIAAPLRKLQRHPEALEALQKALVLNKEVGDLQQLRDTYDELALAYESIGDYRNAYMSNRLFVIFKDSVLNDAKDKDLRIKNEKHNFNFLQERYELLEESKGLERLVAIGASAAFVLLLVFSFFLYTANKTKTRINEQLRATQNQLVVQEKLASLGQLTAGIAHEIQNPLNFINNFAQGSMELLDELGHDDEVAPEDRKAILNDLRQSVVKIHEHGSRADGIVRSMMLHARSSSDNRQYADINTLLNDAARLASHGVRAQGTHCLPRFDTQLDPALPVVSVVPQDISRVFVNILNNAIDAVCERSTTEDGYDAVIQINSTVRNRNVEIRIRDNGIGVPETVRKKMFDPFFTTKDSGKGTGLGLSISYDIIVQKHGGTIHVDSLEGQYTEFTITLPIINETVAS